MSLSLNCRTASLTSVDSAFFGRKVELSLDCTPELALGRSPPSPPTTSQANRTRTARRRTLAGAACGGRPRRARRSWGQARGAVSGDARGSRDPGPRTRARGIRWVHAPRAPRLRPGPRRLRGGMADPARGARPGRRGHPARHDAAPRARRRSTPPASAPSRTNGRSTARPSSTSTGAARSPGTARASSSATRSCGSPRCRSTSSRTCAASRRS